MPKVSVTCVTYNSSAFIRGCLDSLAGQSFRDFEVIIVDNNSSDDTAGIILKEYPFCTLIRNKTNAGYCKAQNQAIGISHGKYIITLNPDIVLDHDFIKEMASAASSDVLIGSVSPKLLVLKDGTKTNVIDSMGHSMGRNRCVRNIGSGETDGGQYDGLGDLFGVSGAAPLHKRSMLESIRYRDEYLDEDFFMGYDDVDIDWRSKLRGWKTISAPRARAWHIRSASAKKSSRMWNYYNYRNRYLTIIKNDTLLNLIKDLPHLLIYEIGMFFSMAVQLQLFPVVISVLKLAPRFIQKRLRPRLK